MTDKEYMDLWFAAMSKLYGKKVGWPYFNTEMQMAAHWTLKNLENVPITENGFGLLLSRKPGSPKAQFGFALFPSDGQEAKLLWEKALVKAKSLGINELSGPLQGSTFFPYRFISSTNGMDYFPGEYMSEPWMHEFMISQSPKSVIEYRSGYRDDFSGVMEVSKPYYDELIKKGLSYHLHTTISRDDLMQVFQVVEQVFKSNWSFEGMSDSEFEAIYTKETKDPARLGLLSILWENKTIGFVRFLDASPEISVCKTMAILPEFQKMGIGNATAYYMHKLALDLDYKQMIYALAAHSNRVKNMPQHDAKIFRSYAAYEFDLS